MAAPPMLCQFCAGLLSPAPRGRPPRFCTPKCRVRRHRWDRWRRLNERGAEPRRPNALVRPAEAA